VPGQYGSWVWLERSGPAGPLDALILERAARALHALTADAHRSPDGLLRIVCDPDASTSDRQDAVTRLRLAGPVTVVLSTSGDLQAALRATVGELTVALLPGEPGPLEGIAGGLAVASDPLSVPEAVEHARVALKLARCAGGVTPSLVRYHDLGVLAALVERFTPTEAAALDDVRRLDDLFEGHPWIIETLQAVADQDSLRQAAAVLHVHHSTLQDRMVWLSGQLGYSPNKGRGRQRAAVAVLLWRVAH